MPQLHPSRRTGRRLLAGGILGAVVVLGTPAVASADPVSDVVGGITDNLPAAGGSSSSSSSSSAASSSSSSSSDPITAGAECFMTAGEDLTMVLTDISSALTAGGAALQSQLTAVLANPTGALSRATLADAAAAGQTQVTALVSVVSGGVTKVVQVVVDLTQCLAALIPTSLPTTVAPAYTPPAVAAPTTTVAPAITTSTAPTQAVAYPGYAPTGGAPGEDDGSPAALVGLGLLTAATGGGALWLRARRGVA